jgi:hypothetical protein
MKSITAILATLLGVLSTFWMIDKIFDPMTNIGP